MRSNQSRITAADIKYLSLPKIKGFDIIEVKLVGIGNATKFKVRFCHLSHQTIGPIMCEFSVEGICQQLHIVFGIK